MSEVLARWNHLPVEASVREIMPCCSSKAWADRMAARRPFRDVASLLAASDETWSNLSAADWMDAFRGHPRIGETRVAQSESTQSGSTESGLPESRSDRSSNWSEQEQRNVATADERLKVALADANLEYEQRFRHIFIVCATGKSGSEILKVLQRRLRNDETTELREAAEQQRLITRIRLTKWLLG
jgi:2-oxo-4-hydroxy-4-carboxy-5-ureidoimidazoline decarboxylase